MKRRWAAVLSSQQLAAAIGLRQDSTVQVCVVDDAVWFVGTVLPADDDSTILRRIPGAKIFFVHDDQQLTAIGQRVPCGCLPKGRWQPIRDWCELTLPSALSLSAEPSVANVVQQMSLVRSMHETPVALLLVTMQDWLRFADHAPQWRLEQLAFVVNHAQQVVVRGDPLPAIPGQAWIERQGICVPAGWAWWPAVAPDVLRETLRLQATDFALLFPCETSNGSSTNFCWDLVRETDWVQATRSAVRLSHQQFASSDVFTQAD